MGRGDDAMRTWAVALALALAFGSGCAPRPTKPRAETQPPAAAEPGEPRALLAGLGVPVYPRSEPVDGLNVAALEVPEGTAYTTAWFTDAPPKDVIAFYARNLVAVVTDKDAREMVVGVTRNGNKVTIVTTPETPKRARITITVRKS
jgi:hypothetical protein